jgi:hypothetical protein
LQSLCAEKPQGRKIARIGLSLPIPRLGIGGIGPAEFACPIHALHQGPEVSHVQRFAA